MTQPVQIMVVDDEPTVCNRLVRVLSKIGAEVETFTDPLLALRRLDEKAFDVVLSDVVMPAANGVQVLQHALRRSPRTKVIIITGFAMMSLAREAMDEGAFDFLAKPFRVEEVQSVVLRAVEALGRDHPAQAGELSGSR